MNKNKLLAKNTIILGIGQFIPKLIAIVMLPILTRELSVGDYGIYDLILSFSSLALPIMTLLIQQGLFRHIIGVEKKDVIAKYITNSVFFVLVISLVELILLFVLRGIFPFDLTLIISIFLLYFFNSIFDVFSQIARGMGKNLVFSISVILYSLLNIILLLLLLFFDGINIFSLILLLILSYVMASCYLFFYLKIYQYINFKYFNTSTIKSLLIYSIPIIPSSISLWVVNLSDRLLVTNFLGTSANGIYAAANKVPNLFGTAYSVFNLAWTEIASRSIDEEDVSVYYSTLFESLFSFLVGVLLLLITFSPVIFDLLIDHKFISGYFQMPILFLGVFFNSLVSFYGGIYVALKETKKVGYSSLAGAIINILVNLVLIKHIGLYAASLSTFISFLLIFIYRYFDLKKYIDMKYNFKKIIIGFIFIIGVTILFYFDNLWTFILSIFISILYNLCYNQFIKSIFKRRKLHG